MFLCHFFLLRQKSNQKKATGKQRLRSFGDGLQRGMAVSVLFVFFGKPSPSRSKEGGFPSSTLRTGSLRVTACGWCWCFCGYTRKAKPKEKIKAESAPDGSGYPAEAFFAAVALGRSMSGQLETQSLIVAEKPNRPPRERKT